MSEPPGTKPWKVLFGHLASQDYVGIVKWTIQTFGAHQAEIYTFTLDKALDSLNAGPDILGVEKRDDLGQGICTLHVAREGRKGRHFVVFRITDERTIEVIRLLHDSMDLPRHLP